MTGDLDTTKMKNRLLSSNLFPNLELTEEGPISEEMGPSS